MRILEESFFGAPRGESYNFPFRTTLTETGSNPSIHDTGYSPLSTEWQLDCLNTPLTDTTLHSIHGRTSSAPLAIVARRRPCKKQRPGQSYSQRRAHSTIQASDRNYSSVTVSPAAALRRPSETSRHAARSKPSRASAVCSFSSALSDSLLRAWMRPSSRIPTARSAGARPDESPSRARKRSTSESDVVLEEVSRRRWAWTAL